MHAERMVLNEAEKFAVPQDLLSELHRRGPTKRNNFHVEGFKKRSLLGRILGLFGPKSGR